MGFLSKLPKHNKYKLVAGYQNSHWWLSIILKDYPENKIEKCSSRCFLGRERLIVVSLISPCDQLFDFIFQVSVKNIHFRYEDKVR